MARRLSKQQRRRIDRSQQAVDLNDPNNFQGLVISHRGGEIEVEPASGGDNLFCNMRSNLGVIVCGDRVVYQQPAQQQQPSIIAILPRDNLLQRLDGFGNIKAVAANVSQMLICLSIEPAPNLFLLDQFLLSAEQQRIEALIVLNKIDLAGAADDDPFQLKAIYQPLGYDVLPSSIHNHINIDALQQHCIGKINVISGVSGVGKSSITQAILPQIDIPIGEISEVNREGRHTTRTSRLYHLPQGGDLIDTPGVRGFNPVLDPQQPIAAGFREIAAAAQFCRFSNCRHINEPGCAVLQAVQDQTIYPSRYENYLKLLQDSEK